MTDLGGGNGGGTPSDGGGPADPSPHNPTSPGTQPYASDPFAANHPDAVPYVADDVRVERERRQRLLVIGLASVSGVVLFIGLVAFLLTRSGGDSSSPTLVPSSSPASTIVVSTTTSTIETTTTTSSTTTTVLLPSAVDAGPDLLASAGQVVTLTAADVGAETPDEFVRWVQTEGPDVTAGVGALGGPTVSFTAPDLIGQIAFNLVVVDPDEVVDGDLTDALAVSDSLFVRLVKDAGRAVFVDGERGDDSAPGTIEAPVRTLAAALATGNDLYVRSIGRYDAAGASLELGTGVDLYGGYDADWLRNPALRVVIDGAHIAMRIVGGEDRVVSAVELIAADAPAGQPSVALEVDADAGVEVRIEHSRLVAGRAGDGAVGDPTGQASVGIDARSIALLEVLRSTVNGGDAGAGWSGPSDGGTAPGSAEAGASASGRFGASGAGDGRVRGGDGADGGVVGDGGISSSGAVGGTPLDPDGESGRGGAGGAGGAGATNDTGPLSGIGRSGAEGSPGESGAGGGGGGGGAAFVPAVGGGGGAGALGGQPGAGGVGGGGGGGSFGVRAVDVGDVVISESLVASAAGGSGGSGAVGRPGESGGLGGDGAAGDEVGPQSGGNGGSGGGGGAGGAGGQGGGGSGGSSLALVTVDVRSVTITSSDLRAGSGGSGGPGGRSGANGLDGLTGTGNIGGVGGVGGAGVGVGDVGRGADGGDSVAWFDASSAQQDVDDSRFEHGSPGAGGGGSPNGSGGVAADWLD